MAVIRGTYTVLANDRYDNHPDSLIGTSSSDTIIGDVYSAQGNDFEFDTIDADGGDDVIYADTDVESDPFWNLRSFAKPNPPWGTPNGARGTGGTGNDKFFGGGARDEFLGGTGNDELYGFSGGDQLQGQDGNDVVDGGADDDVVSGGRGQDVVRGGDGDDDVYGEALVASSAEIANDADDTLLGEAGNDRMWGGAGKDLLFGGVGNDILHGGTSSNGASTLFIDEADRLYGESGDDLIKGDRGNDLLDGGDNNDNLDGEGGSDTLHGGAGNDQINGGFGDFGSVDFASYEQAGRAVTVSLLKQFLNQNTFGAGVDYLRNIEGLIGSSFADTLIGDNAKNTIKGGSGADRITGGGAADVFVFSFGSPASPFLLGPTQSESALSAPDRITDFQLRLDKIDLFTGTGAALPSPRGLSRAANNTSARTLSDLAAAVFRDANGAVAGNQALGANRAALVVTTKAPIAGTYLFINDGNAARNNSDDLLINITGFSGVLPGLGVIPVGTIFA
ncbi:MAG: bluetail domain-containing putative surface protein [Cyanobium sp.]